MSVGTCIFLFLLSESCTGTFALRLRRGLDSAPPECQESAEQDFQAGTALKRMPLGEKHASSGERAETFMKCFMKTSGYPPKRHDVQNTHMSWWMGYHQVKCDADYSYLLAPEGQGASRFINHSPSEAATALENRRVVFVGDSLSAYQWLSLACFLEHDGTIADATSEFTKGMRGRWHSPSKNITLELIEGGRVFDARPWSHNPRPYNLPEVFPKILMELGPRDIIQVNAGAHDNSMEQILETRNGSRLAINKLQRSKDTAQLANAVADAVTRMRQRSPESCHPRVFWRESTPQHFDTVDGEFRGADDDPPSRKCRARSPKEILDAATSLSDNMRNKVANEILAKAGVPVIKVWQTMLTLGPEEHCTGGMHERKDAHTDCTHWGLEANLYMNNALLSAIAAANAP